jgi:hypothetical protein
MSLDKMPLTSFVGVLVSGGMPTTPTGGLCFGQDAKTAWPGAVKAEPTGSPEGHPLEAINHRHRGREGK